MFKCQECGRKFRTTAAAEKAADRGCPKCGGVDIDIDPDGFRIVRPVPAHRVEYSPNDYIQYPPR